MTFKKYCLVWLFRLSAIWDILTCKKFILEAYKTSKGKVHTRIKFDFEEIKNADNDKL